jgi:hypothetical protein
LTDFFGEYQLMISLLAPSEPHRLLEKAIVDDNKEAITKLIESHGAETWTTLDPLFQRNGFHIAVERVSVSALKALMRKCPSNTWYLSEGLCSFNPIHKLSYRHPYVLRPSDTVLANFAHPAAYRKHIGHRQLQITHLLTQDPVLCRHPLTEAISKIQTPLRLALADQDHTAPICAVLLAHRTPLPVLLKQNERIPDIVATAKERYEETEDEDYSTVADICESRIALRGLSLGLSEAAQPQAAPSPMQRLVHSPLFERHLFLKKGPIAGFLLPPEPPIPND